MVLPFDGEVGAQGHDGLFQRCRPWAAAWDRGNRRGAPGMYNIEIIRDKHNPRYRWSLPVDLPRQPFRVVNRLRTHGGLYPGWKHRSPHLRAAGGTAPQTLTSTMPCRKVKCNNSRDPIDPVHGRTRKSPGEITRKLSVTLSHKLCQFCGTSFFRKPGMSWQKASQVG